MAARANIRAFSPRSFGKNRIIAAMAMGDKAMIERKGNSINPLPTRQRFS
jgi:hypothetical protein